MQVYPASHPHNTHTHTVKGGDDLPINTVAVWAERVRMLLRSNQLTAVMITGVK